MHELFRKRAFEADRTVSERDEPTPLDLYEQAASIIPIGAFECNLANDRLSWTGGLFDMFGLPTDRVVERQLTVEMYSEESRELLTYKRSRAIDARGGFSLDANIVRADGSERWIRINAAVRSSNGRAETLYGMKQDITDDHARWEMLKVQAECDPLTGVANRVRFQRFLDGSSDDPLLDNIGALILLDLDGFKQLNDRWGHAAGDRCLMVFGKRLREAFPQARLISRIGGDEFAVLLPWTGSRRTMERSVLGQVEYLSGPAPWNGDLLPVSASVGLAFAEEADTDPQELFIAADRVLYAAKKRTSSGLARA